MTDGGTSVVPVNEYIGVVTRWIRVILTVVVAGAVLGAILLALRPGLYVSESFVQVRPIVVRNDDPNLDVTRQIDTETEVAVARSERVAERAQLLRDAAGVLGTDDFGSAEVAEQATLLPIDTDLVQAGMDDVAVRIAGDTSIIVFTASTDDADEAQALAQSTAVAYLQFRQESVSAGNEESRARLEAREEQLVAELDDLADLIGDVAEDASEVRALAYADVAKVQELNVIGTSYANLAALTVDPGIVLTDATVPTAPEGLPFLAGPITGGLLGLVVALTAAFLADRSDDRLRHGRAELGALGVPMLGAAPVARSGDNASTGASRLYPLNTSGGDAYRRLQGSLVFNLDSENKSTVLVAGVKKAHPATSVAANVGATAARAGRRTLLVGADLRNAQLAKHLGLDPEVPGLSDVILDGESLATSIQTVEGEENLSLLSAGTNLEHPAGVLQSESFARLIAAVTADYDLVVIEAPPVLKVADAVDIAALCDGTVVVADRRSDARQAIADSVDQLRNVGSDVVGVVVADGK